MAKSTTPDINAAADALVDAMVANGVDEVTAEALVAGARPNNGGSVVGNLADLQRLGADQAARSGGIADAFVEPPGA